VNTFVTSAVTINVTATGATRFSDPTIEGANYLTVDVVPFTVSVSDPRHFSVPSLSVVVTLV
jgi:hypothetical protein